MARTVGGEERRLADRVRAGGLVTLGRMVQAQGDFARSATLFKESTELFRRAGDRWWTAFSIGVWGQSAMYVDGYDGADVLFQESLALFRLQDDQWGIGWSLGNLGRLAQIRGEPERSLALLDESLRLKRQVGDPFTLALSLLFQGRDGVLAGRLRRGNGDDRGESAAVSRDRLHARHRRRTHRPGPGRAGTRPARASGRVSRREHPGPPGRGVQGRRRRVPPRAGRNDRPARHGRVRRAGRAPRPDARRGALVRGGRSTARGHRPASVAGRPSPTTSETRRRCAA